MLSAFKISSYSPTAKEVLIIGALLIFFSPFYLAYVYTIPWQVNTDEIVIMNLAKVLTEQVNPPLFGMSGHFDFPAFIFIIYGWLSKFIGGIDLFHFRIVHGLFGLMSIAACYLFFRLFLSRTYALTASVIVGANHSLMAISRMAMRENSALLFEVVALYFLFRGFKQKSSIISFLGGLFAGLTFYVYVPSKLTIFLWFVFLLNSLIFTRKDVGLKTILRLGISVLVGFIIVAGPIIIKTQIYSSSLDYNYSKEQILLFPEGRALQQKWSNATTIWDGLKKNMTNGLTMFNRSIHDHGYIYPNYGNGFIDPITGVLLWIGLFSVILTATRLKNIDPEELFMTGGFIFSWLFFIFLLTKNPNYTRLLIFLPFIGYFGAKAIERIVKVLNQALKRSHHISMHINNNFLTLLILSVIIAWNLAIFYVFAYDGIIKGNGLGSTARYVESRKNIDSYNYYVATNSLYPYFGWGDSSTWQSWIKSFAGENQNVMVINPEELQSLISGAPFTIFIPEIAWQEFQLLLSQPYINYKINNLDGTGSLKAIEVY